MAGVYKFISILREPQIAKTRSAKNFKWSCGTKFCFPPLIFPHFIFSAAKQIIEDFKTRTVPRTLQLRPLLPLVSFPLPSTDFFFFLFCPDLCPDQRLQPPSRVSALSLRIRASAAPPWSSFSSFHCWISFFGHQIQAPVVSSSPASSELRFAHLLSRSLAAPKSQPSSSIKFVDPGIVLFLYEKLCLIKYH